MESDRKLKPVGILYHTVSYCIILHHTASYRHPLFCYVSFSEYILRFDNQDVFLVGEESCSNKKNRLCFFYAFFEMVLLIDEYDLPEANSQTFHFISRNLETGFRCLKPVRNENLP